MDPLIKALADLTVDKPVDVVATVTAVNPDGDVNLSLRDTTVPGVPALRSYVSRAIGDRVLVRVRGAELVVIGAAGAPPVGVGSMDLTVSDSSAPSGQGWQEIVSGQVWAKPGPPGSLWLKNLVPYVPPPPTPSAPATLVRAALEVDTYRGGGRLGRPVGEQGDYSGDGLQQGVWVFGATPWSPLSGKTVHAVRVTVTRYRRRHGFTWGPVPVHFRTHNATSLTLTTPTLGAWHTPGELQLGQQATFNLPVSWGQQFRDGTAKGVAIDSEAAGDNLEANAGLTLEVDYS